MTDTLSNSIDHSEHMKYTLAITLECNLACDYCYIQKNNSKMALSTAKNAIDFIFENCGKYNKMDINFFGGEPLLEFDLIKKITDMIQARSSFDRDRVAISVVTNGTIFSKDVADFLIKKNVVLCISCDGPQIVQDKLRHFPDGRGSSAIVERNIKQALSIFPLTPINAVYSPENLKLLPQVVDYLTMLGARNIYLSPNISSKWTKKEEEMLPKVYNAIGKKYVTFYNNGVPRYISLIDGKIAVILRGGYKPLERCRMGKGEYAFAPSGNVYPCERLIGSDDGMEHCLGNINNGSINEKACQEISGAALNKECLTCGLKDYCMNWCGCTNYHSTGSYNMVSPFMCASEKAAINAAFDVILSMDDNGLDLSHHLSGTPLMNVVAESIKEHTKLGAKSFI
jgi:uncharacterized protein